MAGNLCKVVVLLLPATITVGLLSFCLISDWWINIDEVKLGSFKASQESAFQAYLRGERLPAESSGSSSPTTATTTTATPTTKPEKKPTATAATTTTTTTRKAAFPDDPVDDYDANSSNDNVYDDAAKQGGAGVSTVGEASYDDDEDQDDVKKIKKRETRDTDHVYVTKLWPLVKSKSLYSECVRYEKLTLKLSLQYLSMENKEPIAGTIHYGHLLNASRQVNEPCKGKIGTISCLLNNECVQGTM